MADDAAGAVGGTATKARGAKKKGGKGKAGGRFKKMEKRRGTGIVVLDDDDVTDATASSAQNTQENASGTSSLYYYHLRTTLCPRPPFPRPLPVEGLQCQNGENWGHVVKQLLNTWAFNAPYRLLSYRL
ncbi:hypothetical protein BSL78_18633 [Apostichopus japonicus]|uniref:Uncharacterized protein n=1 Tax=Stichopus japonicus TaxID=307972 RepID=A0A2G8K931_STIJA|nr:hypothetical protein BSL78_18633 [Apostichopus japonicus]